MQQDSSEESWLEEQFYRDINAQNDECEREYVRQRDASLSTVWGAFQDSATSVAHLYRERSSNTFPDTGALWLPFQTAAGTVTTLYKESCDGIKRTSEAAVQSGYQRRARELIEWTRSKKRRLIRREDLLAYLAGKPPPPHHQTNRRSPKPEHAHQPNSHSTNVNTSLGHPTALASYSPVASPGHGHGHGHGPPQAHGALSGEQPIQSHHQQQHHQQLPQQQQAQQPDLHTFKEALVLRPRGPELFAFVANEIARHCKRPASPIDDKMDVCHYNSKRQRFM